jgi:hypothetical protein
MTEAKWEWEQGSPEDAGLLKQEANGEYPLIRAMTSGMNDRLADASEVQKINKRQEILRTIGGMISLLPYQQYLMVEGYVHKLRESESRQMQGQRVGESVDIPDNLQGSAREICIFFKGLFDKKEGASGAALLLRTCYPMGKDMISPHADTPTALSAALEYRIENMENHTAWKNEDTPNTSDYCIHVYPDRDKPKEKIWIEWEGERISLQDGDTKIVGRKGDSETRNIYGVSMITEDGKMILPFRDPDLDIKTQGCSREAFMIVFTQGKIFVRDRASSRPVVITTVKTNEAVKGASGWSYDPRAKNANGTFGASIKFDINK